jgi:hypothetical protein
MSYFKNYLEQFKDKEINIYIDMDGVVADYDAIGFKKEKNNDNVYLNKRPIYSSISVLKEISEMNNVTLYILSCTKKDSQKEGKIIWLSRNMNFIKKENIILISREEKDYMKSCLIKAEFLRNHYEKDKINISIDDAHDVIKEVNNLDIGIIPLHITSILD